MFTVYWTNHSYTAEKRFDTVEAAVAYGKSVHFDFSVRDCNNERVAVWSVFGGLRYYNDAPPHRHEGSMAEFDRYIAGDR